MRSKEVCDNIDLYVNYYRNILLVESREDGASWVEEIRKAKAKLK
jgi:hypothetical protein